MAGAEPAEVLDDEYDWSTIRCYPKSRGFGYGKEIGKDFDYRKIEGVRAEQIDGRVYLMATSSHYRHNEIAGNIYTAIKNQLGNGKCRAYIDGIDYWYHPDLEDEKRKKDYVIPDIIIICDREKIQNGSYKGKSKFVMEVVSRSSVEHDRITKFAIYEEAGVSEYWIAGQEGTLDIYHLIDGKYKLVRSLILCADKDDEDYNADTEVSLREFPVKMTLGEVFA